MKKGFEVCVIALLMLSAFTAVGQTMTGFSTFLDESFTEWEIYTVDEDVRGTLRLRWPLRGDWSQWDVRIGDVAASIEMKWSNDPNRWEIRCGDRLISAETVWRNDFSQWKITDGSVRLTWRSAYGRVADVWSMKAGDPGEYSIYTYYEGDVRDWVAAGSLPDNVDLAMEIAIIFVTIWSAAPKY